MLLYYITDRTQFPGNESQRRAALLETVSTAARCGVEFIQLREKDLPARELELLAREAVNAVRAASKRTRILINSRADVAMSVGADGVHLRSIDISPAQVRSIWQSSGAKPKPVITVSCHTNDDVKRAAEAKVDYAAFGPVFEKRTARASGPESLRAVSHFQVPVLALGGVTFANANSCIEAGATGIAGIRLFQQGDVAESVAKLRSLSK